MAGLATSHCVDDVLAVDRKTTIFSGWLVWRVLAACCGWVVPNEKSSLPSQVHRILGATSDFNCTRQSRAINKHDQRRFGIRELESCNGRQIEVRLGFSCTQMCGRFGRTKLRPFSRRQHEHRQFWLNHQLTSALKWWLEILSCFPPRLVPTNFLSARRRIVSYSDGEGSEAGVGVALWEYETQVVRAGVIRVPEEVRILWDHQKNLDGFNDIFWDRSGRSLGLAWELPGPVPGFSVASLSWHCGSIVELGQWIVIRHQRGHPNWRNVEPSTAFAGFHMVWPCGFEIRPCRRVFPVTAGCALEGRILSFPGVSPSRYSARALLNRHVVGAAHPWG